MSNSAPVINVATADGLVVFDPERRLELEGRDVTDVASDGTSLWAIVDAATVWRRDRESGWAEVATIPEWRANCILPLEDAALVGTSEAHLLRVTDEGVEEVSGFENAEGRADWFTPWGGPPDVRSLATSRSGRIFANVHVGGILRSDDRATWSQTIDIGSDVHEVIAVTPRDVECLLAATARGLALSNDDGGTWEFHSAGLHATYARAVGLCGEVILLTACTGPRGGRAAVYRRSLVAGASFEKAHEGLPEWFADNLDTGWLATSGTHAVLATADGDLFASSDSGEGWNRLASELGRIGRVLLT